MPVTVFENTTAESLSFLLEPDGERYEVPTLARIGVRYSFENGAVDRTFSDVGEKGIRFWCDAKKREVEVVHPTPFDLLLWDMCVRLGFCGGLVNGNPTHVKDLLPEVGVVTAEEFAKLAINAECDVQSPPDQQARWVALLSTAFIERMGASWVFAEALVQNFAQPFDGPPEG
ncbi:hypothetical protein [Brevundimonas sp.]|uniref:hypothetical protein n=1 Tax=Brevundimonas sp. TaxID=1871086 RepID=UPI00273058AD|nr:hypothetical protein [Brevundimonas sp.]MDP1912362.1 hypothetical protein [Brevundimonas sp.]